MKAWQLIEQGWTQGSIARDSEGHSVWSKSANAVCWCTAGALLNTYPENFEEKEAILERHIGCPVPTWNDAPERTKADVVAVLKELDL